MARTPKKKTATAAKELIPKTKEVSVIPMPMINNGNLPEVLTTADTYVEPGDFEHALTQGRATLYYEVTQDMTDLFDSGPMRPENAPKFYEINEDVTRINWRVVNLGNCSICH